MTYQEIFALKIKGTPFCHTHPNWMCLVQGRDWHLMSAQAPSPWNWSFELQMKSRSAKSPIGPLQAQQSHHSSRAPSAPSCKAGNIGRPEDHPTVQPHASSSSAAAAANVLFTLFHCVYFLKIKKNIKWKQRVHVQNADWRDDSGACQLDVYAGERGFRSAASR